MKIIRCECSRCKLYLRASADVVDQDYDSAALLKNLCFEDRKYQTSLIEYAKTHNIVGCLPTGSGKTFIALKLIEHFKTEISSEEKKVFFLANTIPLVNQQAAFIARNSIYKVRHLTGDMEVDYWTQEKWQAIINEFNVMTMTSQIFLNLIKHGYIKFSQIALLIFDECHHACKEHPMANIMKEYVRTTQMDPNHHVPRILGLTATIIKGTCKPFEVPEKVKELEKTMQSIALTYKDYEEVLKHSTSAIVEPVKVSDYRGVSYDASLVEEMEVLSKELGKYRNERKKAKLGAAKLGPTCLDPKLSTFDNVYNLMMKKPSPGDLKVALDDVLHAYKELGLYCSVIAINLRLAFIEFSMMDINDGKVKAWYIKVRDYLQKLKAKLLLIMEPYNENNRVSLFVAPKLKALLEILAQYRENESGPTCEFGTNDKHLCGLIFTDRRTTAQVLAWYLKDLASHNKEKYGFIRPNFVVGTSRSAFESVESRVYARKQTTILNKFRQKECNLLTATSVLEEGIDVPSCNLVVRFDPVTTYTSYIQSMGRARKKGANFYALLAEKNYYDGVQKLETFKEINRRIIAYLQSNVDKIDAGDHSIEQGFERDLIPPICPGGTADSPKITMDSASDVVDRYCMLLPCDGICTLQTLSWWIECYGGYEAVLKMPLNSAVKGSIKGQKMASKELAKQAAYMSAAQKILDAGVLDERLIPVHQTYPVKVKKFFEILVPTLNDSEELEEGEIGAAVEEEESSPNASPPKKKPRTVPEIQTIRREWYSKRQPKLLSAVPLRGKPRSFWAYRIVFYLAEEKENAPWNNLYRLENISTGFGIICSEKLPDVKKFPLYGAFGTMHCSLKQIKLNDVNLDDRVIDDLEDIQQRYFTTFLGLRNLLLRNSRESSFIIVSLAKDKGAWALTSKGELLENLAMVEQIQKTRPPARARDQSASRVPINMKKFQPGTVVFPWYKRPKPAYLVDSVSEMTPLTKPHDGFHSTYKNFVESQYKVKLDDVNQKLLKCKIAGMAVGRAEKDPIQLNYLLEKYSKEDECPVFLAPGLCYSINLPAAFLVQLKFIPSFLHRLSRLLLAREILDECCDAVGWPKKEHVGVNDGIDGDLVLLSSAQEYQKAQEEERRLKRLQMREAKLKFKKKPPVSIDKIHIEQRELHYEFIHPNSITMKDIKLFHEAVSSHHSAKKLTLDSKQIEVVPSDLSLASKFELMKMEDINIESLDKQTDLESNKGPSTLAMMEALSTRYSNEGASFGRLKSIGYSFMTFSVSLFAYCNFPEWGEPLMCQLRNRLLSLQVLHAIAAQNGIGEWLSGSDFNPGASWLPPGKKVAQGLGEIAAANKIHLNVFDELARDKSIFGKSREELESFAAEKSNAIEMAALTVSATDSSSATAEGSVPSTSAASGSSQTLPNQSNSNRPNKPIRKGFFVKHATFTHTELGDVEIANGFNAIVGAFFKQAGPKGAYKALEWLKFRAPDAEGEACLVNDLNRAPTIHQDTLLQNACDMAGINVLISQLGAVEKVIDYTFKDKMLLLQAFTHPSYPAYNLTECYQRLEFLGDAILDLVLTNHVYTLPMSDGYTPEELEDIRYALVNGVTYASLAVRYGLHKHLLSMSKSLTDMIDNFVVFQESVEHHVVGHFTHVTDEECWGSKHIEVPKVLGDLWEAVAGAVFIDSGKSLDTVWKVFYRLMQYEIDLFCETKPKAPIHELKECAKKVGADLKFQRITGKKTLARGRELVKVDVGRYGNYYGAGTNKSRANDAAAKIALKLIKEENLFIQDRDATKIMLLC